MGKPPRLLEATPPFVGHLVYKFQRGQTTDTLPYSGAGDLETASSHWNYCVLGTELYRSLCFQTSVLTLLAYKPSILGILEPQRSLLPAHQKKKSALGGLRRNPT